jgi:D-alanyl-D-alanine carboxypeptidase (penicillin-binding protein 5/6)
MLKRISLYVAVAMIQATAPAWAEEAALPQVATPTATVIAKPLITPSAPTVNAKSFILIDANSGKIIAEKNATEKLPPASLTKMMTLYVISNALHNNQIHLTDKVRVSQDAWRAEGSRMFIKEGDEVAIEDLIKGIIVDSGNDACVAMAEHIGGSEAGFAQIMNQQAKNLGMKDSHFTDSTGLPNPELYTTARDLAILGRALVNNFPEYYPWYQQKWFTYNGIRQPNRNRLLWRNSQVDGIKTGHTNDAGFCLVSSAKRGDMRLLSVLLGAPNDKMRADDSEKLINYGFRFFESHVLFQAAQTIKNVPIYKGQLSTLAVGSKDRVFVTIPSGQFDRINVITKIPTTLQAPLKANEQVGELIIEFDNKPIHRYPLYALQSIASGSCYTRVKDSIRLTLKNWFG